MSRVTFISMLNLTDCKHERTFAAQTERVIELAERNGGGVTASMAHETGATF